MTKWCVCGKEAKFKIGTIESHPLGKSIKIHNVPHHYCNDCGSFWYDINLKISSYAVYAFKNDMDEIDFNKQI